MRHFISLLLLMCAAPVAAHVDFDTAFADSTLRLDYTFSGTNREQHIYLDELSVTPAWYGRRVNLDRLLLRGNGQIIVTDTLGRDTLYIHSFSTLFQEWQTTEEAARVAKSFENVFLIPMPRKPVNVTIQLADTHQKIRSSLTHRVDPADILIRRRAATAFPWRYLRQAGPSREKIDITFVAEGYRAGEMDTFYKDCEGAIDAILSHEPFRSMADRFNFVAVGSASQESGITVPLRGEWHNTILGSNYSTFYSARYLTTLRLRQLHDVLAGVPYEHIIIMANTTEYGGGGIYNSYLMSAAHHATTRPVVVHEFGHSYAGLADEYYYDDQYEPQYPADTEPWEQNITTRVQFASKWQDMMGQEGVGMYEGGGYQSKGVWRSAEVCRMKINETPNFCPVCQRAIRRITDYQTINAN